MRNVYAWRLRACAKLKLSQMTCFKDPKSTRLGV